MANLSRLPELSALRGRQLAVLGCSGLIGHTIVEVMAIANRGGNGAPIRVAGIARNTLNGERNHIKLIRASVTSPIIRSVISEAEYIIYAAGTTRGYLESPKDAIEGHAAGVAAILASARRCEKFVYVSSTRVYGRAQQEDPITEDGTAVVVPMHLDNIYDCSKRLGESVCLWYARRRRISATIVRMVNLYGRFLAKPPDTIVTDLIRQAVQHKIVHLAEPNAVRNYCSVIDGVQGILKALIRGESGRTYNIGSFEHLKTRELAEQVAAHLPFPVRIHGAHEELPTVQRISIQRARDELGFGPLYSFRQFGSVVVGQTAEVLGKGGRNQPTAAQ